MQVAHDLSPVALIRLVLKTLSQEEKTRLQLSPQSGIVIPQEDEHPQLSESCHVRLAVNKLSRMLSTQTHFLESTNQNTKVD